MATHTTIGIIGCSHVGAHVANALLAQGLADEIRLSTQTRSSAVRRRMTSLTP